MNENDKKLNEEQIRTWIRDIIRENSSTNPRVLLEYMNFGFTVTPQEGYDTFIGPFVDVLKVAKVAAKDILSSAKLNLDLLITFDTDKMKAHGEKWKARKSRDNARELPSLPLCIFIQILHNSSSNPVPSTSRRRARTGTRRC